MAADKKDKRVNIRLPEHILARVEALAGEEERPTAQMLRLLVKRGLQVYEGRLLSGGGGVNGGRPVAPSAGGEALHEQPRPVGQAATGDVERPM